MSRQGSPGSHNCTCSDDEDPISPFLPERERKSRPSTVRRVLYPTTTQRFYQVEGASSRRLKDGNLTMLMSNLGQKLANVKGRISKLASSLRRSSDTNQAAQYPRREWDAEAWAAYQQTMNMWKTAGQGQAAGIASDAVSSRPGSPAGSPGPCPCPESTPPERASRIPAGYSSPAFAGRSPPSFGADSSRSLDTIEVDPSPDVSLRTRNRKDRLEYAVRAGITTPERSLTDSQIEFNKVFAGFFEGMNRLFPHMRDEQPSFFDNSYCPSHLRTRPPYKRVPRAAPPPQRPSTSRARSPQPSTSHARSPQPCTSRARSPQPSTSHAPSPRPSTSQGPCRRY